MGQGDWFIRVFVVSLCLVSVTDVEAIREGHQSEVLLSIADEFPADRCFTLVFRGRRANLDLVAESADEAQSWIRGMRKLIENLENMGEREKLDQYLSLSVFIHMLSMPSMCLLVCSPTELYTRHFH